MMDYSNVYLKVLYDFEYETKDKRKISIKEGESLYLLKKTNDDWWQVIKRSTEKPFFVPALYVTETYDSKLENYTRKENKGYKNCSEVLEGEYLAHSVPKSPPFQFSEKDNEECKCGEEKMGILHHKICFKCTCRGRKNMDTQCNKQFVKEFSSIYPSIETEDMLHHPSQTCDGASLTFQKSLSEDVNESNIEERCDVRGVEKFHCVNIEKMSTKLSHSNSCKTSNELKRIVMGRSERISLPSANNSGVPMNFISKGTFDFIIEKFLSVSDMNMQARNENLDFYDSFHDSRHRHNIHTGKPSGYGNVPSKCLSDVKKNEIFCKTEFLPTAGTKKHVEYPQYYEECEAEDISTHDSNDDLQNVPIPNGWRISFDNKSGEQCYVNEVSLEKWYSSTDGEGRLYFFAENSNESSWALPIVTASKSEERTQSKMSEDNSECDSPPLRGEGVQKSRNVKAHSMFLPLEKEKDNCGRTSSIPRNWLEICGVDKDVQKYGNMKRKKIMENGKKMSKKWVSVFVVLTEDTLCFYKDLKSSQSMGLQPELSMQLPGASVESGEKLSRRKHVFLVISGGMQILCDCNSADTALEWRAAIKSAVEKLVRPQYLPSAQKVIREQEKAERTVERTASMRVRNRDASYEDLMSSNEEQQTKIRDRLKKFFIRRPTREILASKGIYKDEPVFGSHLVKICPINQPYVPEFVKKCIAVIESKDENMKADGLYRACGNLSHVQKIRLQVDQNNLSVLETEEDVHVLTGALKLFFRELKEPLIPYHLFNKAVDAGRMHRTKDEKTKMFREVVKQLPTQNRDTLKFLLQHLKRVTFYEKFNRMHIPNLAIVFGPTVMWRETEYQQNMAIDYMQQNLVIEYFLQQVDEIFS